MTGSIDDSNDIVLTGGNFARLSEAIEFLKKKRKKEENEQYLNIDDDMVKRKRKQKLKIK